MQRIVLIVLYLGEPYPRSRDIFDKKGVQPLLSERNELQRLVIFRHNKCLLVGRGQHFAQ